MSKHLRSCVTCARHIRITEPLCPFCKTAVPTERMTPPPRGTPAARLGRAFAVSTLAAAAGSLGGATACGEVANEPEIISAADAYGVAMLPEAGPDVITYAQAYGLAEPEDAWPPPTVDAGPDAPGMILNADAGYGVAEPFDAGAPDVITGGQAYGVAEPEDGGP